jgi:hypothetical protein
VRTIGPLAVGSSGVEANGRGSVGGEPVRIPVAARMLGCTSRGLLTSCIRGRVPSVRAGSGPTAPYLIPVAWIAPRGGKVSEPRGYYERGARLRWARARYRKAPAVHELAVERLRTAHAELADLERRATSVANVANARRR